MGLDRLPGAVFQTTLDRRRLEHDPGSGRRVIGLRIGVFDPAGQAEDQAILGAKPAEPVTEVKDDSVLFGVADPAVELAETVHGAAVPVFQSLGHVAACKIGRAGWLDRLAPGDQPAGGARTGRSEAFVGSSRDAGRTIDHVKFQMVEIRNFVHRFGDREAIGPLLRLELVGRDRDGLVAVGLAVNARGHQIAHAAAAQEISQANEAAAVPREKYRAASGLAVVLRQDHLLVARDVELALHHAVGPAQVDKVGGFTLAEAEDDRADRLSQPGFRRRVVVDHVDPLPLDHDTRANGVRVGAHQLGLDTPVAAKLKAQPVVAIAQVAGDAVATR